MNFSDILNAVGGYGTFQKRLVFGFLVPYSIIIHMWHAGFVYMVYTPDHWCYVKELAHLSPDIQRDLIRPQTNQHGVINYDSCRMYDVNYEVVSQKLMLPENQTYPTKECSNGWVFDNSIFIETAPMKLNWVCKDKNKITQILALTGATGIIGRPFFGFISDRFGRKAAFFLGILIYVFTTPISPLLFQSYITLLIVRLIYGFVSTWTPAYILVQEFSPPSSRTQVSAMTKMSTPIGGMLAVLFAYFYPDWTIGTILYWALLIITLTMYIWVPESAFWLLSRGKFQKCFQTLTKVAKINGKPVPDDLIVDLKKIGKTDNYEEPESASFYLLLKNPVLLKRWIIFVIALISENVAKTGLDLNVLNLKKNVFLNGLLLAFVELPGMCLAVYLMETKLGRRWTNLLLFLICSISLSIPSIISTKSTMVVLILTLIGKSSISATNLVIYQQAIEIFPTNLRDQSISIGNSLRKMFQISIPFIAVLGQKAQWIPLLIFGAFSLVSAVLQLFLPETLDKPLPQTINEAESIGENKKMFSFAK